MPLWSASPIVHRSHNFLADCHLLSEIVLVFHTYLYLWTVYPENNASSPSFSHLPRLRLRQGLHQLPGHRMIWKCDCSNSCCLSLAILIRFTWSLWLILQNRYLQIDTDVAGFSCFPKRVSLLVTVIWYSNFSRRLSDSFFICLQLMPTDVVRHVKVYVDCNTSREWAEIGVLISSTISYEFTSDSL